MRVRVRGVNTVRRKLADGTVRVHHYHRATGMRLDGEPGSPEFLAGIANQAAEGDAVHISDVQFQPIAAEDVATFVAEAALTAPINGITEIAGPARFGMPEIIARYLQDTNDPRKVMPNSNARYYGAQIGVSSLVPAGQAKLGAINYEKWLSYQTRHA